MVVFKLDAGWTGEHIQLGYNRSSATTIDYNNVLTDKVTELQTTTMW